MIGQTAASQETNIFGGLLMKLDVRMKVRGVLLGGL
jgi:hypothetical protein